MAGKVQAYVPSMSNAVVKAKTGKDWAGWFGALDKGARRRSPWGFTSSQRKRMSRRSARRGRRRSLLFNKRSVKPLLPKAVHYTAIGVCGLAAVGGLGYVLGPFVGWQLNGPMLIAAALGLAALGLQIARREN